MSGSTLLLVGLIVGGAVASIVWAAIIAGRKKELASQKREREELMSGIAELLAQADGLQASFRCGTLKRARFAREMSDKIGAISSLIRLNINKFDVFFVKYAEQQVETYLRLIVNPERRRSAAEETPSDTGDGVADAEDIVADDAADADDVDAQQPDEPAADDTDYAIDFTADADDGAEDVAPVIEIAEDAPAATDAADADDAFEPVVDAGILDRFAADAVEEAAEPALSEDADFEIPASEPSAVGQPDATPSDAAEIDSWVDKTGDEYAADFERFEDAGAAEASAAGSPSAAEEKSEAAVFESAEPPDARPDAADVFEAFGDKALVTQSYSLDKLQAAAAEAAAAEAAPPETASADVQTDDSPDATVAVELDAISDEPLDADEGEAVLEDEDDVFDLSAAAPAPPPPEPSALSPFDTNVDTAETISFDRSALADIVAAAGAAHARTQGEAPADPAANAGAGITGDDVVDSIDSFFKLK